MSRSLEKLQRGEFALEENYGRSKYKLIGAKAKKRALELRYATYDYLADMSTSLKGLLPRLILLSRAKQ